MTEEAILKGCLNNDPVAQRELYNRYSAKMLAVCYRYGHSREDAEDMLQEGFIKVFMQIHTFRRSMHERTQGLRMSLSLWRQEQLDHWLLRRAFLPPSSE